MKQINHLLHRFKKIKIPNESVRKEFKNFIFKKYGIEISFENIKYQNQIIYYQAPSVLKQEIGYSKKEIINHLNTKLNERIKNII